MRIVNRARRSTQFPNGAPLARGAPPTHLAPSRLSLLSGQPAPMLGPDTPATEGMKMRITSKREREPAFGAMERARLLAEQACPVPRPLRPAKPGDGPIHATAAEVPHDQSRSGPTLDG